MDSLQYRLASDLHKRRFIVGCPGNNYCVFPTSVYPIICNNFLKQQGRIIHRIGMENKQREIEIKNILNFIINYLIVKEKKSKRNMRNF